MTPTLHAVSWNLTTRCHLRCPHCYIEAGRPAPELSTAQALAVADDIARVNPGLVLIVTGGEPLLRDDLPQIVERAASHGLTVVLGTSGVLLGPDRARELVAAGVQGVGISVDSARAEAHDAFRGQAGAWEAAIRGLGNAREAGLAANVHFSVRPENRHEIAEVACLAERAGAYALQVYFLVCTGRGQRMTDLGRLEYEETLGHLVALQRQMSGRLRVTVRCAPQVRRVAMEREPGGAREAGYPEGCPAGIHYLRIGPGGEVTPCPYMPTVAGRLPEGSLERIWTDSPVLSELRDRSLLGGRCASCAHRQQCGGCRARALAVSGDVRAEDPACAHDPASAPPPPLPASGVPGPSAQRYDQAVATTLRWTAEARSRLERVPSFVRGLVVERVEAMARREGLDEVDAGHLARVRARIGGGPPSGPSASLATGPGGPGEIPWDADAAARLDAAPGFVQPGIRKLMQLRARQLGASRITSELLSQVRDESMMRVSQVMKRFGFDDLDRAALDEAARRMSQKPRRLAVLGEMRRALDGRVAPNEPLLARFREYIRTVPRAGRPWMPEARALLSGLPPEQREEACLAVEAEAARRRLPVVIVALAEEVLGGRELGK